MTIHEACEIDEAQTGVRLTAGTDSSSRHVLEPVERISEVLFGLIMVLTFTCSLSVAEAGRGDVRAMLLGALGCNLAWGMIDGVMYLMGCLAEKARSITTLRTVQKAGDAERARSVIAEALPPPVAAVLGSSELDRVYQLLRRLPAPPARPRLNLSDWRGAAGVFLLVVVSTLPVVMPFMFVHNVMTAQRLSNAVAICLLFFTGYAFGRCTGYHPMLTGFSMVAVGVVLVAITIALGG